MNKVKCLNGHFFDADRFKTCPICGAEVGTVVKVEPLAKPADKISSTTPILEVNQFVSTDSPASDKAENPLLKLDELKPTETLRPENPAPEVEITHGEERSLQKPQQSVTRPSTLHSDAAVSSEDSLRKAVEATASTRASALPKTVAYYDFDAVEPPVGWLVCVKGEYIGRAFECKAGRNRIGRNQDMEINLADDLTVTRDAQAIIIYEPKKKQFFIQAGTGDGLVYLNGEIVFSHEPLASYDVISLGKTEFIFYPLCGEKFSWDEYIKEG